MKKKIKNEIPYSSKLSGRYSCKKLPGLQSTTETLQGHYLKVLISLFLNCFCSYHLPPLSYGGWHDLKQIK